MSEVGIEQITKQLDEQFEKNKSDMRQLIFWYDDEGSFVDDISSLKLNNAKVYVRKENNSILDKVAIELDNPETDYLVYAPFQKPEKHFDHFYDMSFFSTEFKPDRASMTALELGIPTSLESVLRRYAKFFNSKERIKSFGTLKTSFNSENDVELGMIAVLANLKNCVPDIDAIMTEVIKDSDVLVKISKFNLEGIFWQNVAERFGFEQDNPTIDNLLQQLFTISMYMDTGILLKQNVDRSELDDPRNGNARNYLLSLKFDKRTSELFDRVSARVVDLLGGKKFLERYTIDDVYKMTLFNQSEEIIVDWLLEQLIAKNLSVVLNGVSLLEAVKDKIDQVTDEKYEFTYRAIKHAVLLTGLKYMPNSQTTNALVEQYINQDYRIDQAYRKYYVYLERAIDNPKFDRLSDLIDDIYISYVEDQTIDWNNALSIDELNQLPKLEDFYKTHLADTSERTVVIVSDALRFEAGQNLAKYLSRNAKYSVDLSYMITGLPSVTKFGMAEMLPHDLTQLNEKYDVSVDGHSTIGTSNRRHILQQASENNAAVQAKDLMLAKRDDIRSEFRGIDVAYVYHNVIDAEGDKAISEDGVLQHTGDAINEIVGDKGIIEKINSNTQISHFYIIADHGYLYRRRPVETFEKIDRPGLTSNAEYNHRYILSQEEVKVDGIKSMKLNSLIRTNSDAYVSYPLGNKIFKGTGGEKYVHGGSSLQEMVIPMIRMDVSRKAEESELTLSLLSNLNKISSQIVNLEFVQNEQLVQGTKAVELNLYFVDQNGNKVSGEVPYTMKSKAESAEQRRFTLPFVFMDRDYANKTYTLIAEQKGPDGWRPVFEHPFVIDIPL